jgi:signal transduction histidine kinase
MLLKKRFMLFSWFTKHSFLDGVKMPSISIPFFSRQYQIKKRNDAIIEWLNTELKAASVIGDLERVLKQLFCDKCSYIDMKFLNVNVTYSSDNIDTLGYALLRNYFQKRKQSVFIRRKYFIPCFLKKNRYLCSIIARFHAHAVTPLYNGKRLMALIILQKTSAPLPFIQEVCFLKKIQKILAKKYKSIQEQMHTTIHLERASHINTTENCFSNTQQKEISKLLQQQTEVIMMLAHELRTPLNIALIKTESALLHAKQKNIKKDLSDAQKSLQHIQTIIQEVFSNHIYERRKQTKEYTNSISARNFFDEIAHSYKQLIQSEKIHFTYDNDLTHDILLSINPSKIEQVITNLMNNAIKFTKTAITLQIKQFSDTNNIILFISDNGSGIKKSSGENIFQKFTSSHISNPLGIGLGLYLSQQIIRKHGGEIWTESSDHSGTIMGVRLPIQS